MNIDLFMSDESDVKLCMAIYSHVNPYTAMVVNEYVWFWMVIHVYLLNHSYIYSSCAFVLPY